MPDCIVVFDLTVAVEDVVAFQRGSGAASRDIWKLQNNAPQYLLQALMQ